MSDDRIDLDRLFDDNSDVVIDADDILALVDLARAVRDAGPWPLIDSNGFCRHCHNLIWRGGRETPDVSDRHAPDCAGVRVRDALERFR